MFMPQKNEVSKDQLVAMSFMVEVIKREKHEPLYIVRVPAPNGSMAVACMGSIKDFNQFIASL